MMRPLLAVLGLAALLAACEPGSGVDKPPPPVGPPGPHLALTIEAAKDAHYEMLCQVRTYQSGPGQYVNRYGVDTTGPYHDTVLSPNAHCNIKLISGPGPVKVTLSKPGSVQTATVVTPGDAGKTPLHVW